MHPPAFAEAWRESEASWRKSEQAKGLTGERSMLTGLRCHDLVMRRLPSLPGDIWADYVC